MTNLTEQPETVEGWVLVPVLPTDAMVNAAVVPLNRTGSVRAVWSAMIAASHPTPAGALMPDDAARALFEHEMRCRGVSASWDDVDADDRAAWQETVNVALNAARLRKISGQNPTEKGSA